MKERPILFRAPMVRALLAGTKTQTRRVVKPAKCKVMGVPMACCEIAGEINQGDYTNSPYGQPGDRLWVRESHYLHGIWSVRKDDDGKRRWTFHPNPDMGAQFTEPNGFIKGRSTTVAGWYRRPSIHMPRWASRITLEVTGVRVERLQDISEADAIAEGIERAPSMGKPGAFQWCDYRVPNEPSEWFNDPVRSYQTLMEQINGPESWTANPWVWVIQFKRVEAA